MDEQMKLKILEMAVQLAIARLNNSTDPDDAKSATQLRNEISKTYKKFYNIIDGKDEEV